MVAAAILPVLTAVLALVGLVVPTAAAHAQAGTVVAVATAADDAQHVGSVDAITAAETARAARRRSATPPWPAGRSVRATPRLDATSWDMPARVVGGVPPGRAPPVAATRPSGALPMHA